MASLTSGAYPPQLTEEEGQHLIATIKDWSIANGLAVRPQPTVIPAEADPDGIAAVNAPVTVFPSPFPLVCFEQGRVVQNSYDELYAAVSRDEEFISQIVKECVYSPGNLVWCPHTKPARRVAGGDEFIQKLWDIHLKVKEEGYTQVRAGHFRLVKE
jgi:glutathione synthase